MRLCKANKRYSTSPLLTLKTTTSPKSCGGVNVIYPYKIAKIASAIR